MPALRQGSAVVRLSRFKSNGRRYWRLRYHQNGKLQRPSFPKEQVARAFAALKLSELYNGTMLLHQLTPADAASYARARQLLDPVGRPIESVAADYAAAMKILVRVPEASLEVAVHFYAKHHAAMSTARRFTEIMDAFNESKKLDGTHSRHRKDLKNRLKVFAPEIRCPLALLTAENIIAILDRFQRKLEWSNRTRNHYRAALSNLVNFARGKQWLPRDWREMEFVPKVQEQDGAVVIYTPAQAAAVIQATPPEMLPYNTLIFFSGLRPSEVTGTKKDNRPPADWRNLHLATGEIYISEGKVRTAGNRIAHLPPNAAALLTPHAREHGPVVPAQSIRRRLAAICAKAGVQWLQDAARRSYVSYRYAITKNLNHVSQETGTSVATLRRKYLRPVPHADALEYFQIGLPTPSPGQIRAKNLKTSANAAASNTHPTPVNVE